MRQEQFARHWIVLQQVMNSRYGRRIDELARELKCSERTVRRYLEGLQSCGLPIYNEKTSRGTVWKLMESFRNLPPLPFTALDAFAIVLARSALMTRGDSFCSDQLATLLQRLSQGRGPEFLQKLRELESSIFASSTSSNITSHLSAIYGDLSDAIASHRKLRVSYRNANGKLSTAREIAPLHIWIVGQQSYLIAYCYKSTEVRTFGIRRFQQIEMLAEKFENTWSFDLKKHAGESFGAYHNQPESVELVFDTLLENYLKDHPLHPAQKISQRDGLLLLRLKVGINESLIHRILGFGTMVRVVRPQRLAEIVATRHQSAATMYATQPPTEKATPMLPLEFE